MTASLRLTNAPGGCRSQPINPCLGTEHSLAAFCTGACLDHLQCSIVYGLHKLQLPNCQLYDVARQLLGPALCRFPC